MQRPCHLHPFGQKNVVLKVATGNRRWVVLDFIGNLLSRDLKCKCCGLDMCIIFGLHAVHPFEELDDWQFRQFRDQTVAGTNTSPVASLRAVLSNPADLTLNRPC